MQTPSTSNLFLALAFAGLFLFVLFGALGSHMLAKTMTEVQQSYWQTALNYHAIHSLALMGLAILVKQEPDLVKISRFLGSFIVLGWVFFSGGLYLLALGESALHFMIPIGGIIWLMTWLFASIVFIKKWRQ